jgi:hypothetical protein
VGRFPAKQFFFLLTTTTAAAAATATATATTTHCTTLKSNWKFNGRSTTTTNYRTRNREGSRGA